MLILLATMFASFAAIERANAQRNSKSDNGGIAPESVLRVRGLIVVDQNGKDRIQIGAPLPDPLLQGKRYKRQGAISGILLMDGEGNERSGYFTSDEPGTVALTLDTVQGQTAMFLANDEFGANLQVSDRDHKHLVKLNAFENSSNIVVERGGKQIFQVPETAEEKK
jgi:hypothetical protein